MSARRLLFPLLAVLVVAGWLGQPAPVAAQCNVINTGVMTFGTTMVVYKQLSAAALCMTTAMNAFFCTPTAGVAVPTTFLQASAMAGTMNPFCSWSCTCGVGMGPHVVINSNDNLPVELMEFSVEDESTAEGDDQADAEGGDGGTDDEAG